MCEIAGTEYLGSNGIAVLFRDPRDGYVLSLYAFACKSPEDVAIALKNHREPIQDFNWEPVTPAEREPSAVKETP
jgi:hypothetical protein